LPAAPAFWQDHWDQREETRMQAWAMVEFGQKLEQIEKPTPVPQGTEVLIEVSHCGVCHSDLHAWDGYYQLAGGRRLLSRDRGVRLPMALGHEIVGRVAAMGPEAKGVSVGDRRIVYPWVGCGHCDRCQAEQDNMCMDVRPLGIRQDGGFGSHVVVPHPRHLVDPGHLDPALAATYACSGITVYSAIRKLMPRAPHKPIVIVGAGGLGLSAIAVLRALKHEAIVVVDTDAAKLEAAKQAGASAVVDASAPEVGARLVEAAGGPLEAVIDLVNASSTARMVYDALAKGGTIVQVGLYGGELAIDLPLMAMRELALRGSYVGTPQDLRELVALAQSNALASLPITELPKSSANEALQRLKNGQVIGRLVLRADAA
jgi:alcohol dehydrogenase, propanol-preferring